MSLVGRSESWLSQVDRGLRSIDSHSVLVRLAEVLDVELARLTSDDTGADMARYEAAAALAMSTVFSPVTEQVIPEGTGASCPIGVAPAE